MADAIRKSDRRRWWPQHTSNLTTPTHDSTYISIAIDMLFINGRIEYDKMIIISKISNMRF